MPRKNGIVLSALVLLGTLVFSCSLFARSPRADAKNKKTLPRAEQASLFYLEGIKSNVLEGDSARAKAWFKKVLLVLSPINMPSLGNRSYPVCSVFQTSKQIITSRRDAVTCLTNNRNRILL